MYPNCSAAWCLNEAAMKERLPKETYKALKRTMTEGTALDPQIAGVVANAMKDWGHLQGRDALHPLVPAHDRRDG